MTPEASVAMVFLPRRGAGHRPSRPPSPPPSRTEPSPKSIRRLNRGAARARAHAVYRNPGLRHPFPCTPPQAVAPLPRRAPVPSRRAPSFPRAAQADLPKAALPVPEAGAPPPPAARPAPAASEAALGWRVALAAWLQAHKTYPEAARRSGEQGRVVVRFTVARDGQVLDVQLASSSGSPRLDQGATGMLRGARLPRSPPPCPRRKSPRRCRSATNSRHSGSGACGAVRADAVDLYRRAEDREAARAGGPDEGLADLAVVQFLDPTAAATNQELHGVVVAVGIGS